MDPALQSIASTAGALAGGLILSLTFIALSKRRGTPVPSVPPNPAAALAGHPSAPTPATAGPEQPRLLKLPLPHRQPRTGEPHELV